MDFIFQWIIIILGRLRRLGRIHSAESNESLKFTFENPLPGWGAVIKKYLRVMFVFDLHRASPLSRSLPILRSRLYNSLPLLFTWRPGTTPLLGFCFVIVFFQLFILLHVTKVLVYVFWCSSTRGWNKYHVVIQIKRNTLLVWKYFWKVRVRVDNYTSSKTDR